VTVGGDAVVGGDADVNDAGVSDDAAGAPSDLHVSFLELQTLLVETDTFAGFLFDLTEFAKRSFPHEVFCSVTLVRDGRFYTAASSDEFATVADEAQYSGGVGPCLSSSSDGSEVVIADLRSETRFGAYAEKAARLGLRSVVALPMHSQGRSVGAFNIYSKQPGVFTDGSLVRARMLVAAAAGAVEIARRLTEQAELNDDLKAAMASRRVIDQALGITMAQESCDAETAFGLLRRTSQNEHRKLREVAEELVTKTGGVPPAEAPVFAPGRRRAG
jgi:GAF domain-containing protein